MIRGSQRSAVVLGLLLSVTAAAQQVLEYRDLGYRVLSTPADPFVFYVDGRQALPGGNDLNRVVEASKAAAQTWQVSCSWPTFSFPDGGVATTGSPMANVNDPGDRFNVVPVWVTSASDPRYTDTLNGGDRPSAARPLTFSGYVYQCDIFLNAVDFDWSTTTPTPAGHYDIQSVLTHEVGHCLGLGDSFEAIGAVMFFDLQAGVSRRNLADYDRTALCRFYPKTGAVGSPCDTTACTTGLTCVTAPSTVSGKDLKVCAKGCFGNATAECPAPYVCRESSAVSGYTRACLPALPDGVTPVGRECTPGPRSCATTNGVCIAPVSAPSGNGEFDRWDEGYCTETCSGSNSCPAGSGCSVVAGQGSICLKDCTLGGSDCRPGYTCEARPEGNLCVPGCYGDLDCDSNSVCRTCDRVCVPRQAAGKQVGDACTANAECGTNQYCLFAEGGTQGVCAQQCSVSACSCPGGTSCQVVNKEGERACVRACSASSCPATLRCGSVEQGGSACLPVCVTNQDCAPNMLCASGGTCYDPQARPDAGPCTLCNDGGSQPPPPVDAGPPKGSTTGPDGCGCTGAPVSAAAFLGGLVLLLLVAGRRRTWHKQ
ncbi:adhesin [Myxococcus sp. AM011]|uniref:adhesin n=1 Tax=Myxococcus sp. AM011 TaxID=2745200 RepID=UPI0015955BB1|nr:adhesin [Myxococcus sp. AM011]NVJ20409.1 adhesin [Myxococcus sp. AM011]